MHSVALTSKDFASDQDVKWCPGCGDYSILKQMQNVLPQLGVVKEEVVFVSGIGCSSRFPYYMDTYGLHGIHGRAPAIASGLKLANPDLHVWIITGDGDGLSIGGNHLIHCLRRNLDVNILLFNNEIYGLTKGQYSPTSQEGLKTKSSPMGSLDHPFNPPQLALGAGATFVARTLDRNGKHLQEVLKQGHNHKGSSIVEIYQNCPIFNDGVFAEHSDKSKVAVKNLMLEKDMPLIFGKNKELGIRFNGLQPEMINLIESEFGIDDLWVHDPADLTKANLLVSFAERHNYPIPFGVLYDNPRTTYESQFIEQLEAAKFHTKHDLQEALFGKNTWEVE